MNSRDLSASESERCEPLRTELENLARTRNYAQLDRASFPILLHLAGQESGLDGVHSLIKRAGQRMSDREASAVEILLADSDNRWGSNLRERMTGAGKLLGISSYNTFRDRSGELGRSPYDLFLLKLARQVSDVAKGIDAVPPNEGPETVSGAKPSSRSRLLVPAAALVAVAAVIGLMLTRLSSTEGEALPDDSAVTGLSASGMIDGCDIPLGATMTPAGPPPGLVALIRSAFDESGGLETVGCPAHTVDSYTYDDPAFEGFSDLWAQEFQGSDGRPPGAIIVDLDSAQSEWIYQSLANSYFNRIARMARFEDGLPVGIDMYGDNPVALLEGGGIMIGHGIDGPARYIPGRAIARWEELGGYSGQMGLPMTDINYRNGRPTQDYEHGYMYQSAEGEIEAVIATEQEVAEAVDRVDDLLPGILSGFDKTAWWIDTDRVRHYIPTEEVLECLGGASAVLEYEAPGWQSSFYPEGDPATCP